MQFEMTVTSCDKYGDDESDYIVVEANSPTDFKAYFEDGQPFKLSARSSSQVEREVLRRFNERPFSLFDLMTVNFNHLNK